MFKGLNPSVLQQFSINKIFFCKVQNILGIYNDMRQKKKVPTRTSPNASVGTTSWNTRS
jgi:hypothetical protein